MKQESKKYCPTCKADVVPVIKMFNTAICPNCSKILASDRGIDKVG